MFPAWAGGKNPGKIKAAVNRQNMPFTAALNSRRSQKMIGWGYRGYCTEETACYGKADPFNSPFGVWYMERYMIHDTSNKLLPLCTGAALVIH